MTAELRKIIELSFELILLGAIVAIVSMSSIIGRASLKEYVAQQDVRNQLPEAVEFTKGSVGYYELVDLIDSYAQTTDIIIKYKDRTGNYSTMTFTTSVDGKTVKLALGTDIPKKGVPFTGLVYSRQAGTLYRNGVQTTTSVLESDMKLPLNTFKALNALSGNGVLDYSFIEVLFDWARDERFVCTLTQTYETQNIDTITLQMQK